MVKKGDIVEAIKSHTKESFMSLVSDMGYRDHEIATIGRIFDFIDLVHEGEYRETLGKEPYIHHPLGVADLIMEDQRALGIRSPEVVCGALLHDSFESMRDHLQSLASNFQHHAKEISWLRDEHPQLLVDLQLISRSRDPALSRMYFPIFIEYGSLNAHWVKSVDRRHNTKTVGDFKTKSGEVDHARIKRKIDETLDNFPPLHEQLHRRVLQAIEGDQLPEEEHTGWLTLASHLHEELDVELKRYGKQMRPLRIT